MNPNPDSAPEPLSTEGLTEPHLHPHVNITSADKLRLPRLLGQIASMTDALEGLRAELAERDEEISRLKEQNALFRGETRICADCDGVAKKDYDALRARVAELEEINALRVPGSCQCGDDDLCAIARRANAAEARNARIVAAGNAMRNIIEVAPQAPPATWPTDDEINAAVASWEAAVAASGDLSTESTGPADVSKSGAEIDIEAMLAAADTIRAWVNMKTAEEARAHGNHHTADQRQAGAQRAVKIINSSAASPTP
jgi:hypothetical protein